MYTTLISFSEFPTPSLSALFAEPFGDNPARFSSAPVSSSWSSLEPSSTSAKKPSSSKSLSISAFVGVACICTTRLCLNVWLFFYGSMT